MNKQYTAGKTNEHYIPKRGETVMVSNDCGLGQLYFVQKFVIKHNGLFYCERDDGDKNMLIGWKYLIENQDCEYMTTSLHK